MCLFPVLCLLSCWLLRRGCHLLHTWSGVWWSRLAAKITSLSEPVAALTLPILRAWAAECSPIASTRVNLCPSSLSDWPATRRAVLLLFWGLPLVSHATGGEGYQGTDLPGSFLGLRGLCWVAVVFQEMPFGNTSSSLGKTSVVSAQLSCHGELQLEPGLA